MPVIKIHRMREQPRTNFRWASHTAGAAQVKPKDYDLAGEIEATSAYSAWTQLKGTNQALDVGDLLEDTDGNLRIFKYVGFEEARWLVAVPVTPSAQNEVSLGSNAAGV